MTWVRSRTGGRRLGVKRGLDHVAKKGGKAGFPRKEIQPCEHLEKETGTSFDKVLTDMNRIILQFNQRK